MDFVCNENGFTYIGLNPADEIIESNMKMYLSMSKESRMRFHNMLLSHDLRGGRRRVYGINKWVIIRGRNKMKKPYVIAEMGVNFYDTARVLGITPLDAAKLYIDKAAEAGIDCAKFQSYKADTIVSKNSPAYWDTTKEPTKTQYELFLK